MKVIAVANQKGGVGKTTVTRELSACCALRGYQTLVIDCDPQANLTASWVEPDIYNITLSHVLIVRTDLLGRGTLLGFSPLFIGEGTSSGVASKDS